MRTDKAKKRCESNSRNNVMNEPHAVGFSVLVRGYNLRERFLSAKITTKLTVAHISQMNLF